jgi:hypothetical protein
LRYAAGVVRRDELVQHLGTATGSDALRAENILVSEGNAGEGSGAAFAQALVGLSGGAQRRFIGNGDKAVEPAVQATDAIQEMAGQFHAGIFFVAQRPGVLGNGSVVHRATILQNLVKV